MVINPEQLTALIIPEILCYTVLHSRCMSLCLRKKTQSLVRSSVQVLGSNVAMETIGVFYQ